AVADVHPRQLPDRAPLEADRPRPHDLDRNVARDPGYRPAAGVRVGGAADDLDPVRHDRDHDRGQRPRHSEQHGRRDFGRAADRGRSGRPRRLSSDGAGCRGHAAGRRPARGHRPAARGRHVLRSRHRLRDSRGAAAQTFGAGLTVRATARQEPEPFAASGCSCGFVAAVRVASSFGLGSGFGAPAAMGCERETAATLRVGAAALAGDAAAWTVAGFGWPHSGTSCVEAVGRAEANFTSSFGSTFMRSSKSCAAAAQKVAASARLRCDASLARLVTNWFISLFARPPWLRWKYFFITPARLISSFSNRPTNAL